MANNLRCVQLMDYSRDVFDLIAQWSNDPEIQPYAIPRFNEGDYIPFTGYELMVNALQHDHKFIYMVYDDLKPIGEFSIDLGFGHKVSSEPSTAWISLVIGDKDYWGKGVGAWMMQSIEQECRNLGIAAIELGVFEFNERALKLYQKLGYERIAVIPDFVYSFGKWHADIRMLKKL